MNFVSNTALLLRMCCSPSSADPSGAGSLLPIVSSQRERFKQRNAELEAVSSI